MRCTPAGSSSATKDLVPAPHSVGLRDKTSAPFTRTSSAWDIDNKTRAGFSTLMSAAA